MARIAGRTPEQTRRKALDAAAKVFRERGVAATLDDVAKAAGLSKGGLFYHFAGKDELLQALLADLTQSWRQAVHDAVEPGDHGPGKLARGYIRASLLADNAHELRDSIALAMQLTASPALVTEFSADLQRWEVELAADGLPPSILHVVIAAADGGSVTALWGEQFNAEDNAELSARLIAMTHAAEAIDAIIAEPSGPRDALSPAPPYGDPAAPRGRTAPITERQTRSPCPKPTVFGRRCSGIGTGSLSVSETPV